MALKGAKSKPSGYRVSYLRNRDTTGPKNHCRPLEVHWIFRRSWLKTRDLLVPALHVDDVSTLRYGDIALVPYSKIHRTHMTVSFAWYRVAINLL